MRKVFFRRWNPAILDKETNKSVPAHANKYEEPGYFHTFSTEGDTDGMYPIAIIEDEAGYLHSCALHNVRFMHPQSTQAV